MSNFESGSGEDADQRGKIGSSDAGLGVVRGAAGGDRSSGSAELHENSPTSPTFAELKRIFFAFVRRYEDTNIILFTARRGVFVPGVHTSTTTTMKTTELKFT
jgi:hypothetical protein